VFEEIIKGSVFQWQELEAGRSELRLYRVLGFNKPEDYVLTIEITVEDEAEKGKARKNEGDDEGRKAGANKREWVVRRKYSEVAYAIATGGIRVLEEIHPRLIRAEKDIKPSHRQRRDKIHNFLKPLLGEDSESYMLDSRKRGTKINELSQSCGGFKLTKMMIYKHYRAYLESGFNPNVFLPLHDKCGAPGKRRVAERPDMPKPGRLSALGKIAGRPIGIRITANIEQKFERGIKRFYKDGASLEDSFNLTTREYFYKELKVEGKKRIHILLPPEERPTFDQYKYFYEKVYRPRDPVAENKRRKGERRHNLEDRATTGDAQSLAFGPGSLYQIDATIGDAHMVSSFDRLRLIGRPVVYGCMDVFSHALAGTSALLEGPSWLGAMLALDVVMMDKVLFCAEYGIEIDPSEWPIQGWPQALCADRGEFEGFDATNLVKGLKTRVDNTAPYRADWKGIVERQFGLLNQRIVNFLPGRVRKLTRGESDPRLRAVLTPDEFRQVLILYALDYNMNFHLEDYRMDEFMIGDGVECYPLDLWNWGVQNRGKNHVAKTHEQIRLNLLPRRTVTVTGSGIHFEKQLYYTCDLAERENWFSRANVRGTWEMEAAFDLRTNKRIYLITDGGTKLEPCRLTAASQHLNHRDFYEMADYFEMERQAEEAGRGRRLQARTDLFDKVEAIVSNAGEQKEMALMAAGKISKSVLLSGVKENRARGRDQERQAGKWLLGEPEVPPPTQAEAEDQTDEIEEDQSYAAPSMLDVLRQQREEKLKGVSDNVNTRQNAEK
jgi:putative transposase